jgi:Bacteriocin-protection, YdeI or OmpD-Associated/Domain of unknown function (DUF1905)
MTFAAVVEFGGKSATGIEVPESVIKALGAGKRPLIKVTLNGFTYRSAIGVMGGRFLIPVSADIRGKAGVVAGDQLEVTVELDTEPRQVEVPADLARELASNPSAEAAFEVLSNSGKKRHTLSIEGAKTDETRQRRLANVIAELSG